MSHGIAPQTLHELLYSIIDDIPDVTHAVDNIRYALDSLTEDTTAIKEQIARIADALRQFDIDHPGQILLP